MKYIKCTGCGKILQMNEQEPFVVCSCGEFNYSDMPEVEVPDGFSPDTVEDEASIEVEPKEDDHGPVSTPGSEGVTGSETAGIDSARGSKDNGSGRGREEAGSALEELILCPHCGARNSAEDAFCGNCGNRLGMNVPSVELFGENAPGVSGCDWEESDGQAHATIEELPPSESEKLNTGMFKPEPASGVAEVRSVATGNSRKQAGTHDESTENAAHEKASNRSSVPAGQEATGNSDREQSTDQREEKDVLKPKNGRKIAVILAIVAALCIVAVVTIYFTVLTNKCPVCGRRASRNDRICEEDGAALGGRTYCMSCGYLNEKGAVFCEECGERLAQ